MRKSRIEKVIQSKINSWINSITDETLQNEVRKNVIVTGGCIVSLLNNESPNDYDVYFRTKEIAKKVAEYYCSIFNAAHKDKTNRLGRSAHAWVLDGETVQKYQNHEIKLSEFAYGYTDDSLPSGMITSTPPERIKVMINSDGIAEDTDSPFTCNDNDDPELVDDALNTSVQDYLESIENEEETEEIVENYLDDVEIADEIEAKEIENLNVDKLDKETKYRPVFLSTNAITLSDKIQLIFRFYGEPDKIHDTFDYVHCMCYWTSWENKLVYTTEALDSIINKELKYVGSKYPICSVLRMRKFISRGWTINAGQILKMAFQISELDLQDINVLEDQLVGVDSLYFSAAISQLRKLAEEKRVNANGDPIEFSYDSSYLATVIDKIFK